MSEIRQWVFPKDDPEGIAKTICEARPDISYEDALAHAHTIIAETKAISDRFGLTSSPPTA